MRLRRCKLGLLVTVLLSFFAGGSGGGGWGGWQGGVTAGRHGEECRLLFPLLMLTLTLSRVCLVSSASTIVFHRAAFEVHPSLSPLFVELFF